PDSLDVGVRSCDGVVSTGTTNDGNFDRAAMSRVLELLKGTGKPFVYTSGIWVLGDTGGRVVDENAPANPVALVAWRPAMEQMVLSASADTIRAIVVRPGVVYGRGGGIAADFVQSARGSGAARYVGAGENRWPVVDVDDLADLYASAVERAP